MQMTNQLTGYTMLLRQTGLSAETQREYVSRVRRFLDSASMVDGYLQVDQQTLERYIASELSLLSKQTARNYLVAIRHFSDCMGIGLSFPSIEIEVRKPAQILSVDELIRYLKVVNTSPCRRDRAIIALFATTGLRMSEIRDARFQDVPMLLRRIKSYMPQSNYPAALWAEDALTLWTAIHPAPNPGPMTRLFCNAQMQPLSRQTFDMVIRKFGWKARLSVCSETLRNTYFASLEKEAMNDQMKRLSYRKSQSIQKAMDFSVPPALQPASDFVSTL